MSDGFEVSLMSFVLQWKIFTTYCQCSILSGVGGFNPPLVPLNPQVFFDPQKNSQKFIAAGFTRNWVLHTAQHLTYI